MCAGLAPDHGEADITPERPFGAQRDKGYLAMSDFDRGYARPRGAFVPDMAVDQGLRSFMLGVLNKLAIGLVISAGLAYVTGNVPAVRDLLLDTAQGILERYGPL